MLSGLGKGIAMRLAAYAVFVLGFVLLFRAFENSSILVGLAGGIAVLAAMWLMVGFRSPPWMSRNKPDYPDSGNEGPIETEGKARTMTESASSRIPGQSTPGIPYGEAARAVNYHRGDSVVVSTSAALREWSCVSDRRELDLDLMDCMDRAPAVGLGLALAQPDEKVLVLDCDATLRTNLGGLATIGESRPSNLVHFVFDDAARSSTGGVPIRELDHLDLVRMAESSGYARAYHFDRLEELLIGIEEALQQEGPVFILVSVFQDEDAPSFPGRSMAEGWAQVREQLAAATRNRAAETN